MFDSLKQYNSFFVLILQALAKFQTTHKVTTLTGIEQEESLLSESAMMENSLNSQILDLENESKIVSLMVSKYREL
jgi:protein bicaudal D